MVGRELVPGLLLPLAVSLLDEVHHRVAELGCRRACSLDLDLTYGVADVKTLRANGVDIAVVDGDLNVEQEEVQLKPNYNGYCDRVISGIIQTNLEQPKSD